LALARHIGILSVRLGPAGARTMNPGPRIGQLAPPLQVTDITGRDVTLGANLGKRTLLVFLSTQCSTCLEILPGLKTLYRTEKDNLEIVLISPEPDIESCRAYAHQHGLSAMPFIASSDLATRYQVGISPYAILVDRAGIVKAKGLVNNTAHLESLFNAEEVGHPSIQSYMQRNEVRK